VVNKRGLSSVVLASLCLAVVLFAAMSIRSSPAIEYNPWMDVDDDGKIDMVDMWEVARRFGTLGEPKVKASIEYDSGWVNITDKAGQYFNITHNLNSTDIMVDITGKATLDGGIHQRHLGLTGYAPGWSKTYGGVGYDQARCVIQTDDGGYAMVGTTNSFGPTDFYLVKTDANGNMQWNKTYNVNPFEAADYGYSVVQTEDGGYAMAGYTYDLSGWKYFCLIKTDSSGNKQWSRAYSAWSVSGEGFGYSVVQASDGGYAIAGCVYRGFALGYKAVLLRTNASGYRLWDKAYGMTYFSQAYSVVKTSDGGYALAGTTGSMDFWLVKTDANGNMQWDKTYAGTSSDFAYSIIQTSDGGYALAGYTGATNWGYDCWLVKTDSSGNHLWNKTYGKTYGGISNDYAYSVVQTSDGGYALAGYTNSSGAGGHDFYLVKTDASGNMQWDRVYGGIGEDFGYSVVRTSDGGYALAGYTNSSGAGWYDFWLIKTDTQSGVGLAWTDSTKDNITLYRGTTDPYWNYVRVRVWKIRETP